MLQLAVGLLMVPPLPLPLPVGLMPVPRGLREGDVGRGREGPLVCSMEGDEGDLGGGDNREFLRMDIKICQYFS